MSDSVQNRHLSCKTQRKFCVVMTSPPDTKRQKLRNGLMTVEFLEEGVIETEVDQPTLTIQDFLCARGKCRQEIQDVFLIDDSGTLADTARFYISLACAASWASTYNGPVERYGAKSVAFAILSLACKFHGLCLSNIKGISEHLGIVRAKFVQIECHVVRYISWKKLMYEDIQLEACK